MFATIEEFCKSHEYTTAAIGAFSTLAAVVVSLALAFLSLRATKTRLRADLAMSIIIHNTLNRNNPPTYLTVSITNIGNMALRVPFSFFRWRLPMGRGVWLVNPLDSYGTDPLIPRKYYPVELAPRASQTFYVSDVATFKLSVGQMRKGASLIDRVRFRFIKAIILSDDGRTFAAKIRTNVRKHLR
jgi:hypothetical protein